VNADKQKNYIGLLKLTAAIFNRLKFALEKQVLQGLQKSLSLSIGLDTTNSDLN
jgi:hypothetical protein